MDCCTGKESNGLKKLLLKSNLERGVILTADKKVKTSTGWSARVTRDSNALDIEEGVFTWSDPKKVAKSLALSAENSKRRKSSPYRSAMSMLTFYINRAGKNLSDEQLGILEQAKSELRKLYNRE